MKEGKPRPASAPWQAAGTRWHARLPTGEDPQAGLWGTRRPSLAARPGARTEGKAIFGPFPGRGRSQEAGERLLTRKLAGAVCTRLPALPKPRVSRWDTRKAKPHSGRFPGVGGRKAQGKAVDAQIGRGRFARACLCCQKPRASRWIRGGQSRIQAISRAWEVVRRRGRLLTRKLARGGLHAPACVAKNPAFRGGYAEGKATFGPFPGHGRAQDAGGRLLTRKLAGAVCARLPALPKNPALRGRKRGGWGAGLTAPAGRSCCRRCW